MLALTPLRSPRMRCYSSSNIYPLPPLSEWRKIFDASHRNRRARVCLSNPQTAARVANSFFPPVESTGGIGKVVVEAFPGPGALTRALLELPTSRIRKLIVLEDIPDYFQRIQELESCDPRVKAVNLAPMSWDTYAQLEDDNLLNDIETPDWQQSDLEFICHIPHSVHGEQFMAQILRAIPEHSWLFKYGRMRMNLIMAESLYNRIDAPLKKKARCKLSVIAEATTDFRQSLHPGRLKPYDNHFWPPTPLNIHSLPESRKPGHPMISATFLPLQNQVTHADECLMIQPTMLDKWDYCLRRLFVLKTAQLRKALPSLAPGANNMMQYLEGHGVSPDDQLDTKLSVNELTVGHWARIVRAFDKWPFAPDMLYIQEGITEKRI
ncbi:S-adenosyl-L-methionine-dependent methyltransferase [Gautieria morchelliformis]|nr:S-adenosyl-L-methionine-dependent methyltransferase [Gautieria morchelliformis]